MKIVLIGGTGLIGKKLIPHLTAKGHDVLAASPSKSVNAVTGEGLDAALNGADIVADVANAPTWEDVALSIVNTDRLPDSGYFRAKAAQEKLIKQLVVRFQHLHSVAADAFANAGIKGPLAN